VRIPKTFKLAGSTWVVEQLTDYENLGTTHRDECKIVLRENLQQQVKEHTFLHELCHAIKYMMGQEDHDEVEIDAFAAFLHQFHKTAK
jgi:hypothetical protein